MFFLVFFKQIIEDKTRTNANRYWDECDFSCRVSQINRIPPDICIGVKPSIRYYAFLSGQIVCRNTYK
jgi:hypothetical protein